MLGWALPLVGVALGAYLSERADARRWKRDWVVQRIAAITSYFGEVCDAVDAQHKVTGQTADAVRGERRPVPHARVEAGDRQWGRVLARRGVSAGPNLQRALSAFDVARGTAASAINSGDGQAIGEALEQLTTARRDVLRAMKADQQAINEDLAPLLLPQRVVWWRRLRRRPLSPMAVEWTEDDD